MYSPYELETISEVLASMHATVDPEPEGKTIERIDVVPLEVFEQRDPLPRVLNLLHATTRRSVVRREMLLREGDPYSQTLCDDTLRNLRHLVQLSVVLVVATPGSDEGKVRVVVITKDVWSLRLNWNVVVNAGGLEQLYLQPSEFNVAGIHHNASGTFILEPSTYTLGLGYSIPRLGGTRVALQPEANVIINRTSGAPEGSYGELVAGQPLYSGLAEWAWAGSVAWQDYIARQYVNAAPSLYKDPATGKAMPFAYRSRGFGALYEVTRSVGWEVKHDVSFAASVNHSLYYAAFPSADARTVADFSATNVPASNDTIGPVVSYQTYTKRYVRLIDFETLGLQEDASLGHEVILSARPSFKALGGSYDVIRFYAAGQYSWALRDGYFRVAFASTTDFQSDHIGNAAITPAARLVTPTLAGLGRLVVDGLMLNRWRDELNIKGACEGTHTQDADTSLAAPFAPCTSFIGGSDRLRGFPTNLLVDSKDFVAYTVELRSRPVELLSLQLAGTLFYDAAGAGHGLGNFPVYQSVGVGLRAIFPWLDREVFRADIGFPIERPLDPNTGAPVPPYGFLISFGQAFGIPSVGGTSVLPTGQSSW